MNDVLAASGQGKPRYALDPRELQQLASLALRARVIVEGAYAGMHHNPHTGSSIEFAEHKEYSPGDDIRHIDWKAVARVGRYYIKQFEDETEMRCFMAVDGSASMGYRGQGVSKLEYACYLAAAFGHLLAMQGDPAGLLLFDDATRTYLPPRLRPGHVRDLFSALEAADPAGRTDPARALGQIGDIADRRSMVLLFTDLFDLEGDGGGRAAGSATPDGRADSVVARLRQLTSRGHDVVLFHLMDPDEVDLPFDELTRFEGVEPGDERKLLCDPRDLRAEFRRASEAFRERWRLRCLEASVEVQFTTTDVPPSTVLRRFLFGRRKGKR